MGSLNRGVSYTTNELLGPDMLEDLMDTASLVNLTGSELISGSNFAATANGTPADGDVLVSSAGKLQFHDGSAFQSLEAEPVQIDFTNTTAVTLVTGMAVVVDPSAGMSVELALTTTYDAKVVGVVGEVINPSAAGAITIRGRTPVRVRQTGTAAPAGSTLLGPSQASSGSAWAIDVDNVSISRPQRESYFGIVFEQVNSGSSDQTVQAYLWR